MAKKSMKIKASREPKLDILAAIVVEDHMQY